MHMMCMYSSARVIDAMSQIHGDKRKRLKHHCGILRVPWDLILSRQLSLWRWYSRPMPKLSLVLSGRASNPGMVESQRMSKSRGNYQR